jgi:cytochrome b6-f complex iron-sulfur subunit
MTETRSPFLSRRQFIVTGSAALAAAWLGGLIQSSAFSAASVEARPVEVMFSALPVGGTTQITFAGGQVLVSRSEDGVLALSMTCTHLGCTVQWDAAKRVLHCPCHDGYFDEFGDVISGPPPLPLERLPVKLLPDRVIIGETIG